MRWGFKEVKKRKHISSETLRLYLYYLSELLCNSNYLSWNWRRRNYRSNTQDIVPVRTSRGINFITMMYNDGWNYSVSKTTFISSRFILNYNKKHPFRNSVAIEYKAAMLLMPSVFFGLSLGVMIHKIVPNFIQEIALLLVLLFCFYESVKKGIQVWKEESNEFSQILALPSESMLVFILTKL